LISRRWLWESRVSEQQGRSRRCYLTSLTEGTSMDADFDLLLTAVYVTADDLLREGAKNAKRSVTDAEAVTRCASPRRSWAFPPTGAPWRSPPSVLSTVPSPARTVRRLQAPPAAARWRERRVFGSGRLGRRVQPGHFRRRARRSRRRTSSRSARGAASGSPSARRHVRVKARFRSRAGFRPTTLWLVVSASNSLGRGFELGFCCCF
jgi:hypothetical protein